MQAEQISDLKQQQAVLLILLGVLTICQLL
jgi:hypothetical protein